MTTIGAVAEELGLSVETLRYYERAQLSSPPRDRSGRRDYRRFDIDQLRLVTQLRAVGVPIQSIRQLLSAKVQGASNTTTARRALNELAAMEAALRERQDQLEAARHLVQGWAAEIQGWLDTAASTSSDWAR